MKPPASRGIVEKTTYRVRPLLVDNDALWYVVREDVKRTETNTYVDAWRTVAWCLTKESAEAVLRLMLL